MEQQSLLPIRDDTLKPTALRLIKYGVNDETVGKSIALEERITYTWSDLNMFVEDAPSLGDRLRNCFRKQRIVHKHILKHVSGVAHPGELVAILGPSGSGKSSLLHALTFRNGRQTVLTGLRCANGGPLTHHSLATRLGYVQQDDAFYPNLSVKEHLQFHADVRMGRDIPHLLRTRRVDEVLLELTLQQCQDQLIAGLSGGERKRLAIAAEILTNPALLLCDEPTSALDASVALNVVQMLRRQAQTGRTVIATICQPSSQVYALFDKVIFMSDGRIVFQGTRDEAQLFFACGREPLNLQNHNPADWYLQLLAIVPGEEESCRQAVHLIWDSYNRSEFGCKIQSKTADTMSKIELSYNDFWSAGTTDNVYENRWMSQFRAVLWRSWLTGVKEPLLIKVSALQSIIISLLVGILCCNQQIDHNGVATINGVIFVLLIAMTLQHLFAVVHLFSSEFTAFQQDYQKSLYRTDVYFLCKSLVDMAMFTLFPVVSLSLNYYMIGLSPKIEHFLIAICTYILVTHVVVGFGYLIFSATSSVSMAFNVAPILLISLLLFSGYFLNISAIPVFFKWLSCFSWFRYSFAALMINQWSDIDHIVCSQNSTICPPNGDIVLDSYHIRKEEFSEDIIMLVLLVFLYRVLAYVCLMLKISK